MSLMSHDSLSFCRFRALLKTPVTGPTGVFFQGRAVLIVLQVMYEKVGCWKPAPQRLHRDPRGSGRDLTGIGDQGDLVLLKSCDLRFFPLFSPASGTE